MLKGLKGKLRIFLCTTLAIIMMTGTACAVNDQNGGSTHTDGDFYLQEEVVNVSDCIIKDGKSDYKIVIANNASSDILFAANELQSYLKLSTGAELQIVTDNTVSYSQTAHFISIGENSILTQANITVDKSKLGNDGLRYVNKDKSLFLFGGSDIGTLYSVYEYLKAAINFETYAANTTVYDENVKVLPLSDYNITYIPSFDNRIAGNDVISSSATTLKRLKQSRYVDSFILVNGRDVHNVLEYLPYEQYRKTHPNWYNTNADNPPDSSLELCYTAHGNASELTAMINTIAEVIKGRLKEDDGNIITFTHRDNDAMCNCTACRNARSKYTSDAGSIIKICNRVNRIIRAWFNTDEGRPYARDLKILFFAYRKNLGAPVTYNSNTKKYVPIDNDVVCDDGVVAFMAPIELDYTKSIYDTINSSYLETFKKWSAVSKEIYLWLYQTNFDYFLVPYDNFGQMQELYQFCEELGVEFMYDQGQLRQSGIPTGFMQLKSYLSAKLMWNTHADVNQLTQDFFTNVYGPASSAMKTIYNEYRVNSAYIKANNASYGGSNSVYMNMLRNEYWPKNLLVKWRGLIQTALESIENLKLTTPAIYDRYYTNIQAEVVWVNYLLYKSYIGQFDTSEKAAIQSELYTAILTTEVAKQAEGAGEKGSITDLLNKLSAEK